MIRIYDVKLAVDSDEGSYSLMLGTSVVTTITPDEPMTGIDALRELLADPLVKLPLRKAFGGSE